MDSDLSSLSGFFLLLTGAGVLLTGVLPLRGKAPVAFATVLCNAAITSVCSVRALGGVPMSFAAEDAPLFGHIPVMVDPLSGWFILLINFTAITGAWYGMYYMRAYSQQTLNLSLHWLSYIVMHASLLSVCVVQNSLLFLVVWELMTLSCFALIIFEHTKRRTLKAGVNFLIQSHIGVVFLTIAFIWVASRTGSYDFSAMAGFASSKPGTTGIALFLCFFIGFAFKSGFVPFHTWLPYAHPAAPSHISGIMSGVIIKIGIYGMLRMILLIKADYTLPGYILLTVSVISGIYGVTLAIVQHNLKKLLAYHSIENIGIIGMGIGLGCVGLGTHNLFLTTLGFAGGMLHALNHSLFKSLLFYGAGNVYQSMHTMNIERLGGMVKRMPHTTLLFLIAALAICGLPPFNGFISEFLIYTGMFAQIGSGHWIASLAMLSSIFGLVMIGGLAMLCFTKAFGTVFLGTPRHPLHHPPSEAVTGKLFPMYLVAILVLAIGIFPGVFLSLLSGPITLFTDKINSSGEALTIHTDITQRMQYIGWCSAGFMALIALLFLVRKAITSQKTEALSPTWGCGYVGDAGKMQYTANSFVRSYRKLVKPFLSLHKKETEISGIFPKTASYETDPHDKAEEWLIDIPLMQIKHFFGRFRFLQNGNTQFYVLYGVAFLVLALGLPVLYDGIIKLIGFFNNL